MLNTKHLLSGGAMIASVAIAAPVWAKTAMPVGAVAGVSPMAATVLYKQMPVQDCIVHQRGQHRVRHASRRRSGDIANRLNRAELSRLSLSTMPPAKDAQAYAGAPNMAGSDGGGNGQPSPTQGISGAWQASASSHAPNEPWAGGMPPGGNTQLSGSSRPPSEMGRYPMSPAGYAAQGSIDAPNLAGPNGGGYGPPGLTQGMPGGWQASASSHVDR